MALKKKIYEDAAEKKKDYWRGFWLWWGLNILLCLVQAGLSAAVTGLQSVNTSDVTTWITSILGILIGLVPLVINIGLLIYFALTRSQIALGMLVAFGVALGLVIVIGIIATVACFVILGSSTGSI